jgi:acetyl esterase
MTSATASGMDAGAEKVLAILAQAQAKGVPGLHEVSVPEARAMNLRSKELFGSDGADLAVSELELLGTGLGARLYRAAEGELPTVVFYHGGGWVIGSLDTHDAVCRDLAALSGAAVLSVDYGLAPERPFPGPVEDAYAALQWVAEHGRSHGLDAQSIAVAGDSAGGNLAAVVALMARDQSGPAIKLQALLYPATDMHMDTESHQLFRQHLLTPQALAWFQGHYLRSLADRDDWRASPLRAQSLAGLPAAYVLTAGFDPLRDEGQAYAGALAKAGVAVEQRCFEGQIHGFLTLDKIIPQAREAVEATAQAIKAAFSPTTA